MTHKPLSRAGFTLLELLVALLIVSLLVGVVGPKLFGEADKAKVGTARAQMKTFADALERYYLNTGHLPATDDGLKALWTQPPGEAKWGGPYLAKEVPPDPWGHPYVYRQPGANQRDYDLLSLGADGRPGGTGLDTDIVWQ